MGEKNQNIFSIEFNDVDSFSTSERGSSRIVATIPVKILTNY